jgi:hypothetical protein
LTGGDKSRKQIDSNQQPNEVTDLGNALGRSQFLDASNDRQMDRMAAA